MVTPAVVTSRVSEPVFVRALQYVFITDLRRGGNAKNYRPPYDSDHCSVPSSFCPGGRTNWRERYASKSCNSCLESRWPKSPGIGDRSEIVSCSTSSIEIR